MSFGPSVGRSVPLYFLGVVAYRDACARLMAIGLVFLETTKSNFVLKTVNPHKKHSYGILIKTPSNALLVKRRMV